PPGACTWTAGVSQSFPNSVTIQGVGAASATAGGASTTGTDQTVILNHTSGSPLFSIGTTAGKSFRFTGIALTEDASSPFTASGTLNIGGTSTAVRVDHNHFMLAITGSSVDLNIVGVVQGVADHNFFDSTSAGSITNDIAFHNGIGWNGDTGGN